MKEMTIQDVQHVSIDILKEIDLFCRRNDIRYSVGYGALIGAIRHKGCIPWDDDIDIIMPRPDYEKFIKTYHSPGGDYEVFAPELGNCYYTVSRICEMKKTYVRKSVQWNDVKNGVWVDIFPIDEIIKDKKELWKMSAKCYVACRNRRFFSFHQSLKYNVKSLALMVKYGYLDRQRCISRYLEKIKDCNFDNAVFAGNYASPYRERDIHHSEIFKDYTRVEFENIQVNIISMYDKYLYSIYGDYMKLPPIGERNARRHSTNNYFWKSLSDD